MDALVRVGEHLSWARGTAPTGELVLLRDGVDAGGAFLVHHFIALFSKAGRLQYLRRHGWLETRDERLIIDCSYGDYRAPRGAGDLCSPKRALRGRGAQAGAWPNTSTRRIGSVSSPGRVALHDRRASTCARWRTSGDCACSTSSRTPTSWRPHRYPSCSMRSTRASHRRHRASLFPS